MRALLLASLATAILGAHAFAVENIVTDTYNNSPPVSTDIPNWTTGWTQPAVQPTGYTSTTGWNYVGTIDGNSAVYLGNGWVATAAHVGVDTFFLNGVNYPVLQGSTHTFGSVDLVLFQVSPSPRLPSLAIRAISPVAFSSPVAILGNGHVDGSRPLSWGYNTVTEINEVTPVTVGTTTYSSYDFWTLNGTNSNGSKSATNDYQVVVGDSGGAAFIFNSTTQQWELAGINEVDGTVTLGNGSKEGFSGFIQLSTYASQILPIISTPVSYDTPTMPQWALVGLASMLLCVANFRALAGQD